MEKDVFLAALRGETDCIIFFFFSEIKETNSIIINTAASATVKKIRNVTKRVHVTYCIISEQVH